MRGRSREEVLNVVLALLLNQRGIVAAPEQILRQALAGERVMPDVLVDYQGLRVAIEGKVARGAGEERAVLKAARERVEQGIAHIGIAVLYQASLRRVGQVDELERELERSTLKVAVVSEVEEAQQLAFPLGDLGEAKAPTKTPWAEGNVDHLGEMLRRVYEKLVAEDVVARAVAAIRAGMERFAPVLLANPGALERARQALGIREGEVAPSDEATGEKE